MMIIIQILCAYIPATALTMINANFDERKISLAGSMDEIGTECAYVLREILQQNKESWGALGAQGVLVNIFMIALTMDPEKKRQVNIEWKSKDEMKRVPTLSDQFVEKMAKLGLDQSTIDKLVEASGGGYPVTAEQLQKAMEKVSES